MTRVRCAEECAFFYTITEFVLRVGVNGWILLRSNYEEWLLESLRICCPNNLRRVPRCHQPITCRACDRQSGRVSVTATLNKTLGNRQNAGVMSVACGCGEILKGVFAAPVDNSARRSR